MLIWLVAACAQISNVYASRPIILSPTSIDVNSTNPTMEISLPADLQTGFVAFIIRDQFNREFEYTVLDADTTTVSHIPQRSLVPGNRYCWGVQHFHYTSDTSTSEQHCFKVNDTATATVYN